MKAALFERAVALIAAAVEKFGGAIQALTPDEMLVYFGASAGLEAAAEKALWSALEINRQTPISVSRSHQKRYLG